MELVILAVIVGVPCFLLLRIADCLEVIANQITRLANQKQP
jgi:hypothetical protein